MLMCDVLAERDQQIKLKKRKDLMRKSQEKQWEEFDKQQLEEADEKVRHDL